MRRLPQWSRGSTRLAGPERVDWPVALPEGREVLIIGYSLITFLAFAGLGWRVASGRRRHRRTTAGGVSFALLLALVTGFDLFDRKFVVELLPTYDVAGSTHLLPWPSCPAADPMYARGPEFRLATAGDFQRISADPECANGATISFALYVALTASLAAIFGLLASWVATSASVTRATTLLLRLISRLRSTLCERKASTGN